jgi:hypothetical protein
MSHSALESNNCQEEHLENKYSLKLVEKLKRKKNVSSLLEGISRL